MKNIFAAAAAVFLFVAPVLGQFPSTVPTSAPPIYKDGPGGPVAIGQMMAQPDPNNPARVTIVQAPAPVEQGGGLIQLKVFGWLEPYADALAQALIAAGIAWFAKSRYSGYLDDSSRAALETFAKNRASSLIADGFVNMSGKTVDVHSPALAAEASKAATMIPDALKRFNLTPDVVAAKIVDAIPQTPAGAQMVAQAHAPETVNVTGQNPTVNATGDVNLSGPPTAAVPA